MGSDHTFLWTCVIYQSAGGGKRRVSVSGRIVVPNDDDDDDDIKLTRAASDYFVQHVLT